MGTWFLSLPNGVMPLYLQRLSKYWTKRVELGSNLNGCN